MWASLFARKPLPQLSEVMDQVVACSELLPDLIERLLAGDQAGIRELTGTIRERESLADRAKNRFRDQMPVRYFMPVDRRDLLELVHKMDSIADDTEDVGALLSMRELQVPESMKELLRTFCRQVGDTVHSAQQLVDLFEPLQRAGFRGSVAEQAKILIKEINRQEHETDKTQDQLAKALFHKERSFSMSELLLWNNVLRQISHIADHAENVGNHFRLFLAR